MDVHPQEEDIAIKLMENAMLGIREECKNRYGIDYNMPIGIELKIGDDWSNLETVRTKELIC